MLGPGKYFDVSLAVLFIIAICCACESKKKAAPAPAAASKPAPAEPSEKSLDPKAALEVACFEGDQDACDQLGH